MLGLTIFALAGCSGGTMETPSQMWRNLRSDGLNGRKPTPGADSPYPNLADVPPRPTPPSAAARAAVDAALARERSSAAQPIVPGQPLPPRPEGLQDTGTVPASPPRQASIGAASRIPAEVMPGATPSNSAPAAQGSPARPGPASATTPLPRPLPPVMPDAPPAAPPPALMAPALAPPPAPSIR